MPSPLALNSTGPDVRSLQTKLNARPPSSLPPLKVDGIFGPRTLARVREFQQLNGLKVDGIVGPKTLARLDTAPLPAEDRARLCANGDPRSQSRALAIQQRFLNQFAEQTRAAPLALPVRSSVLAFGLPKLPSLPTFKKFSDSTLFTSKVRNIFGSSVDFSRVFISDKEGLEDRAFTAAVSIPTNLLPGVPVGVVQVMNLGNNPDEDTVVHELTHVWQSQHHSDPFQFMRNCVACQGVALGLNTRLGGTQPQVKQHPRWPVNFPMSAYAFIPGQSFGNYGGEQIAQSVERGETAIISHVKGVGPGAVDADNVTSLRNNTNVEDRRDARVKI